MHPSEPARSLYHTDEVMRTKRAASILSLLFIFALLIKNADALSAARSGLLLLFNAVIPSLFPFFAAIGVLESKGFFSDLSNALSGLSRRLGLPGMFLPCFLLGAISGYPSGARMCGGADLGGYAALCNLCSPIFIVGVCAVSLLGNGQAAIPILIGHYGAALLSALAVFLFSTPKRHAPHGRAAIPHAQKKDLSLTEVLADAMFAMLRIGGCIVFFLVVSALLRSLGVLRILAAPLMLLGVGQETAEALLTGFLEFTGGCQAVAALAAGMRVKASLAAFLITFGGLSVFVQAQMFVHLERPGRYLMIKAAQAAMAGAICYLLFPLFFDSALEAMAVNAERIGQNAVTGLSLFVASAATLSFIYLSARISKRFGPKARTRRNQ